MSETCEVCGRGYSEDEGHLTGARGPAACYGLGYERLKAENASLLGSLRESQAEAEHEGDKTIRLADRLAAAEQRVEAAEKRNTELQGALRAAKNLTHLQHANPETVRWVGEEVGRIVGAALHDEERSAPGRAEPPAGPSDSLSKTAAQGEEK